VGDEMDGDMEKKEKVVKSREGRGERKK